MVDMFIEKMCNYCLNSNCTKKIRIENEKKCTTYKCDEYIKDKSKIVPYQEPLIVTAERSYVTKRER